jgi:predicted anti-sigma-YlaC factor YlaD
MNCKAVQQRLSAYLDRELTGSELLEMRDHLGRCRECRSEEADLRSLKSLLCTLQAPEPSQDLAQRLCHRIQREEATASKWSWQRTSLAFTCVAIASMVLTFFVLSLRTQHLKTSPQGPDVAFDVAQDQAYEAGADPTMGAAIIPVANYVGKR